MGDRAGSHGSAQGGCPKYLEYESLWESLVGGEVQLLRGTWLEAQLKRPLAPLPKRQELPAGAAWDAEELVVRYEAREAGVRPPDLIVVSYCWHTRDHPDPMGQQMRLLGRVLAWSHKCPCRSRETAVFIDWCSLYQAPRTPEQDEVFKRAMKKYMNIWYAHAKTDVLMLTDVPTDVQINRPYHDRGWPTFEFRVSGLISQFRASGESGVFDLGKLEPHQIEAECTSQSWASMHSACCKGILPPATPEVFARILEKKTFTRPTVDKGFCIRKYQEVFEETTGGATELLFQALEWGDDEVEELVDVFPSCKSLLILNLRSNQIGDVGAQTLAKSLPKSLRQLNLRENQIGDVGAQALAQAFGSETCPNIRVINLSGNSVGDAGVADLAEAVGRCTCVQYLYLAHNAFGSEGAGALAQALHKCIWLHFVDIEGNPIDDSTADELRWVWLKQGRDMQSLFLTRSRDSRSDDRVPMLPVREAIDRARSAQKRYFTVLQAMMMLQGGKLRSQAVKNMTQALQAIPDADGEATDMGQAIPQLVRLLSGRDHECQSEAARAVQMLARHPATQESLLRAEIMPRLVALLRSLHTPVREAAVGAIRSLVTSCGEGRRLAVRDGGVEALVAQLASESRNLKESAAVALASLAEEAPGEFVPAVPHFVEMLSAESAVLRKAAASVVWSLGKDRSCCGSLVEAGVVGPLVRLLGSEPGSPVRCQALGALRCLLDANVASDSMLVAAGAVPLLVRLLAPGDARERDLALRLLRQLVARNAEARRLAKENDAHEASVGLLDFEAQHVQRGACELLCSLVPAQEAARLAGSHIARLIALLRFWEAPVKVAAAAALVRTVETKEQREEVLDRGTMPVLVDMLYSGSLELQLAGAGLLKNLAWLKEAKMGAHKEGAVEILGELLHSPSPDLQEVTALALRNLATDANVKVTVGKIGIIQRLVGMLSSESPNIQEQAAGALRNLVYQSAGNKQAALNAKCFQPLLQALDSAPSPVKVQAVNVLVNLTSQSNDVDLVKHVRQKTIEAGAIPVLQRLFLEEDPRLREKAELVMTGLNSLTYASGGNSALKSPLTTTFWKTTNPKTNGKFGGPPPVLRLSPPVPGKLVRLT